MNFAPGFLWCGIWACLNELELVLFRNFPVSLNHGTVNPPETHDCGFTSNARAANILMSLHPYEVLENIPRYSNHVATWWLLAKCSAQKGKVSEYWYPSTCTKWRPATLTATSTSKKRNWTMDISLICGYFFSPPLIRSFLSSLGAFYLSLSHVPHRFTSVPQSTHPSQLCRTQFMLWDILPCVLVQTSPYTR